MLECDASSITISVNEENFAVKGDVVWTETSPTDDGTDAGGSCKDCRPIVRRVGAVVETAADFSCPENKFCYHLSTELLSLSDLYDEDVITKFGLENNDGTSLESLFGCPHTSSTERFLARRFPNDPNDIASNELDRFTKEYGKSRQTQSQRVTCSPHSAYQGVVFGQCVHTNCFVGDQGSPSDCFECGNNCNNGCGSDDLAFDGDFFGLFDFGPACCDHDHCWSTTIARQVCDRIFLYHLLEACKE